MWWKKKWVVIAVLAAVVLVVGAMGGVALAQSSSTSDGNTGKTILARVAEILGIEQQKLEDAFAQAQQEARSEALEARLDELVEEGRLTQEEADQYKEWWQSRPDVPLEIGPEGRMWGGFRGGGHCFPGSAWRQASPSPSPAPSAS